MLYNRRYLQMYRLSAKIVKRAVAASINPASRRHRAMETPDVVRKSGWHRQAFFDAQGRAW